MRVAEVLLFFAGSILGVLAVGLAYDTPAALGVGSGLLFTAALVAYLNDGHQP